MPALFLLLAPVAVVPATRRFAWALVVVPWAIVALAVLRGPEDGVPRAFGTGTPNPITTVDFGVAPGGSERPPFTGKGVYYLKHRLPGTPSAHDPALATYGVGAPSYALGTDTYVLDLFGLGDPMTSHLELEQPRDRRAREAAPETVDPGSPAEAGLTRHAARPAAPAPVLRAFTRRPSRRVVLAPGPRRAPCAALHAARRLLRDVPRAARRRTVLRQPRCVVHQLRVPHPT